MVLVLLPFSPGGEGGRTRNFSCAMLLPAQLHPLQVKQRTGSPKPQLPPYKHHLFCASLTHHLSFQVSPASPVRPCEGSKGRNLNLA